MIRHGSTPGNELKRYIGRTDEPLSEKGIREVMRLREALDKLLGESLKGRLSAGNLIIAASPMKRTVQTAQILLGDIGDAGDGDAGDAGDAGAGDADDAGAGDTGGAGGIKGVDDVGGAVPLTSKSMKVTGPLTPESAKVTAPLTPPMSQHLLLIPDLRECDFGSFENKNHMELAGDPDYQRWIDSNASLPFPGGESREGFQDRCCRAFLELLRISIDTLILVVHGGTIMSIAERFAVDEAGQPLEYFNWHIGNAQAYIFDKFDQIETTEKAEDDHFLRRTGRIGIGEETGSEC